MPGPRSRGDRARRRANAFGRLRLISRLSNAQEASSRRLDDIAKCPARVIGLPLALLHSTARRRARRVPHSEHPQCPLTWTTSANSSR